MFQAGGGDRVVLQVDQEGVCVADLPQRTQSTVGDRVLAGRYVADFARGGVLHMDKERVGSVGACFFRRKGEGYLHLAAKGHREAEGAHPLFFHLPGDVVTARRRGIGGGEVPDSPVRAGSDPRPTEAWGQRLLAGGVAPDPFQHRAITIVVEAVHTCGRNVALVIQTVLGCI